MMFVVFGMVLIHLLAKTFGVGTCWAGVMAVAGITPFGKIAKVGKGVKMTAKATEAVNTAKKYLLEEPM